ncbi:MAG TPA: tRNA pseudouridine(55) synthase TruB, partial [Steroidobacteraceae bacterium]|nr:tRNA pseudouridine(55) synthase TruB [Steroidobacteraceae bacterium]
YSALKRNGVPLYRLARAGQIVERAARAISIDEFTLLALDGDRLELRVLCSKGTYVRVLAEDLARALGTCGRLYSLRREFVEPFAGLPMVQLEQLEGGADALAHWPVLPADRAVEHLPPLHLDGAQATGLVHGRPVMLPAGQCASWRLYDAAGRFLGLGRSDANGELRVQRLFSQPLAV